MLRLMLQRLKSLLAKVMRERNACQQGEHEYYCAQRKGQVGEVILYTRRLSKDDAARVISQPELAQQVCPDGEVICRRCHEGLGSTTQPSVKTLLQGKIHPRNHFSTGQ